MSELCKNCETEIVLNFCGHCGQKKTKRIDKNYIKDEVQYTLIHTNKGFFYSIKNLLRNPGKMAREFVAGNRVNHYKPLALVFILSGLVAFLNTTLIHQEDIYAQFSQMQQTPQPYDMKSFMSTMMHYYSFVMLLNVPLMAFFTWLCYKKWGYNYYENIIICAYYLSLVLVLNLIVIIPVQLLLKHNVMLFMFIPSILSMFIMLGTYFWFFIGLYDKKSPGDVILRSLLLMGIFIVSITVLSLIAGIIIGIYFPEMLNLPKH